MTNRVKMWHHVFYHTHDIQYSSFKQVPTTGRYEFYMKTLCHGVWAPDMSTVGQLNSKQLDLKDNLTPRQVDSISSNALRSVQDIAMHKMYLNIKYSIKILLGSKHVRPSQLISILQISGHFGWWAVCSSLFPEYKIPCGNENNVFIGSKII